MKLRSGVVTMNFESIESSEQVGSGDIEVDAQLEERMDNNEVRQEVDINQIMQHISTLIAGQTVKLMEEIRLVNENLNKKIDMINANLKKEIMINVNKEIDNRIVKVESKVEQYIKENIENIEGKIDELDKRQDKNFNEIIKRIDDDNKDIRQHINIIKTGQNNLQSYKVLPIDNNIIFHGDKKIHPKVYMKHLKELLNRGIIDMSNIKMYIRNSLKGDAEIWHSIIEDRYENLEQFEKFFLENYWGEHQQSKVRENLFNGKYKENYGENREKYIIKKYNYVQYLDPKMPDEEIVKYLARHFDNSIRNFILIQGIDTIEKLLQYLRRIDDVIISNGNQDKWGEEKVKNELSRNYREKGNGLENRRNENGGENRGNENGWENRRNINGWENHNRRNGNTWNRSNKGTDIYRRYDKDIQKSGDNQYRRNEGRDFIQNKKNENKEDDWDKIEEVTTVIVEPNRSKNF